MRRFCVALFLLAACDDAMASHLRAHAERDNLTSGAGGPSVIANSLSYAPNGTNEFLACGDPATFDSATNVTWAFWVRATTSWCGSSEGLWTKYSGAQPVFRFRCEGSGIWRTIITGGTWLSTSSQFAADTWYHVVVRFDGGQAGSMRHAIFRNAVDITGNNTINSGYPAALEASSTVVLTQAADSGGSIPFGPGFIDEPMIWIGRSLTQSEISELYNGGVPVDPRTLSFPAPTYWWRNGDGDTHPTVTEQMGTGVDCTANNGEADDFSTTVP